MTKRSIKYTKVKVKNNCRIQILFCAIVANHIFRFRKSGFNRSFIDCTVKIEIKTIIQVLIPNKQDALFSMFVSVFHSALRGKQSCSCWTEIRERRVHREISEWKCAICKNYGIEMEKHTHANEMNTMER